MSTAYFWDGSKVITYEGQCFTDNIKKEGYNNMLCVDTVCIDPDMRYGKFNSNGWVPVDYSTFPPLFKSHLLLLT